MLFRGDDDDDDDDDSVWSEARSQTSQPERKPFLRKRKRQSWGSVDSDGNPRRRLSRWKDYTFVPVVPSVEPTYWLRLRRTMLQLWTGLLANILPAICILGVLCRGLRRGRRGLQSAGEPITYPLCTAQSKGNVASYALCF